jgi:hypothetical protein
MDQISGGNLRLLRSQSDEDRASKGQRKYSSDEVVTRRPRMTVASGGAATLFDEEGHLTSENSRKFFKDFMQAFTAWIEVHVAR